MARLRKGRANTARGAANFLRETISRVRYAGATGRLTMRADSGFYTHPIVAACRKMKVRYSITVRQHAGLRNLIGVITCGKRRVGRTGQPVFFCWLTCDPLIRSGTGRSGQQSGSVRLVVSSP